MDQNLLTVQPSITASAPSTKSKLPLILLILVLMIGSGLVGFWWWQGGEPRSLHLPSTYNQCVKFPGSKIEKGLEEKCGMPSECTTFYGDRFVQSLFKERLTNFSRVDPPANWNKHVNKEWGFEFKYPNTGKIASNQKFRDLFKLNYPENINGINFRLFEDGLDLKKYIYSNPGYGNYAIPPEIYDLQNSNTKGYRFLAWIPENGCYDIAYLKGGARTAVEIMTPALDSSEETFNQILSTFRFLD